MPRKSNTRAAQGSGSIRQRPDGTWEARVTIGTNPGTGKPIRRSLYGKTQKEVRQKMTAVLRNLDRGTYQTPNKITVGQWMDEWLSTFCANKVKPLTFQSCYEMTFFKGKRQRNLTCQIVQNIKRHLKGAKTAQISGIGHSVIRGLVTTGQWFSASTTVYYRGSPQGRRHSFVVDC